MVLNLIVESQAGIVLHKQGLDGNTSDKTAFHDTIKAHIKQLQNSTNLIMWSAFACETEALLFIMTLCLSVYAAIEFRIRQALILLNLSLPNQLGKQVKNPTARWIFACFSNITVLYLNKLPKILNLKELHRKIIDLLGLKYHKYYCVI